MALDQDVARGLIVLLFGIIGTVVAYMEQIAYTNKWILTAANLGTVTLQDLQILTIVLVLLIGVVIAVVSRP